MLANLSDQEIAILLATRYSENAQTVESLALNAEAYVESAKPTLLSLVAKNILEPCELWDGSIAYIYSPCDYAQAVYDAIYGPLV